MADPVPQPEGSFEIGKDESWAANMKRLFDETFGTSLTESKRGELLFNGLFLNAQQQLTQVHNVGLQVLQNATENANALAKQMIAHRGLETDRIWNQDEVSALTAKSGAQADALIATLVGKVADVLLPQVEARIAATVAKLTTGK